MAGHVVITLYKDDESEREWDVDGLTYEQEVAIETLLRKIANKEPVAVSWGVGGRDFSIVVAVADGEARTVSKEEP